PAIERIWRSNSQLISSEHGAIALALNDNSGLADMPVSFLDKTFQVRFNVPKLILKDWLDFLKDAMKHALPDHSDDGFHKEARIFQVSRGETIPTPREMNLFVNDLSALERQWCKEAFPLAHLAYFIVLQRSRVDVLIGLN